MDLMHPGPSVQTHCSTSSHTYYSIRLTLRALEHTVSRLLWCAAAQNLDQVVSSSNALAQIFWDAFVSRYGQGGTALLVLLIPIIAVWFCCYTTMCYVARWGSGEFENDAMHVELNA
jgi:hypothetical protein